MTDREKVIVMAYTGVCMLKGKKFGVFHAYIEDIMGRPIYTHELAMQSISDEIKEKSRDDFIKLCREEQEPCEDAISRQAVLEMAYDMSEIDGEHFTEPHIVVDVEDIQKLPPVNPQPCEDAISRQAALDCLTASGLKKFDFILDARDKIKNLPPVTPQQKTGHWIIIDDCEKFIAKCSECGQIEDSRMVGKYAYCHCGARMIEPQESEE